MAAEIGEERPGAATFKGEAKTLVPEVTSEPNYDEAITTAKSAA